MTITTLLCLLLLWPTVHGCVPNLPVQNPLKPQPSVDLKTGTLVYAIWGPVLEEPVPNYHCGFMIFDKNCTCLTTVVLPNNNKKRSITSLNKHIRYEEYWLEENSKEYKKALFDLDVNVITKRVVFEYVDEGKVLGKINGHLELGFITDFLLFTYDANNFPGMKDEKRKVAILGTLNQQPPEEDIEKAVEEMKNRGIAVNRMRRMYQNDCPTPPPNAEVDEAIATGNIQPYGGK